MIDAGFFRRFYIGSSVLCAILVVGAFIHYRSFHVAGGVLAGCALGVFPFVTWQIIGKLLMSKSGQMIAVALTVIKFGILAGALYLLLTRKWVNHWALIAGLISISVVFFLFAMIRLAAAPTKEVA